MHILLRSYLNISTPRPPNSDDRSIYLRENIKTNGLFHGTAGLNPHTDYQLKSLIDLLHHAIKNAAGI